MTHCAEMAGRNAKPDTFFSHAAKAWFERAFISE